MPRSGSRSGSATGAGGAGAAWGGAGCAAGGGGAGFSSARARARRSTVLSSLRIRASRDRVGGVVPGPAAGLVASAGLLASALGATGDAPDAAGGGVGDDGSCASTSDGKMTTPHETASSARDFTILPDKSGDSVLLP